MIGDLEDADEMAEDEAGIDLFGDSFDRDYDRQDDGPYRGRMIDDDEDIEGMDLASRRQLEARLNRRDRELANQRRLPAAFLQEGEEDIMDLTRQPRRRRHRYDEDQDDMDMHDDIMNEELSLESLADVKAASLTDWVANPAVHKTIAREFKAF